MSLNIGTYELSAKIINCKFNCFELGFLKRFYYFK